MKFIEKTAFWGVVACFLFVFGFELSSQKTSLIGCLCLSWTAGCVGFCIGLDKGCQLYKRKEDDNE